MTVQGVRLTMATPLAVASTLVISSPASADGTLRDHAVEGGRLIGTALATANNRQIHGRTLVFFRDTVSITTLQSGGGCSATAAVQTQWGNGYVVQPVTVTNTGTSALTSWIVTFTLPAGHAIVGSWNAALTISGQTITARNMPYNGNLGLNATTTFGLQVSRPHGNP